MKPGFVSFEGDLGFIRKRAQDILKFFCRHGDRIAFAYGVAILCDVVI